MILEDEEFFTYVKNSRIRPGKKGGTFLATYEVAPEKFKKYGIVLPKGGMILPRETPEEVRAMLTEKENLLQKEEVEKKEAEKVKKISQLKIWAEKVRPKEGFLVVVDQEKILLTYQGEKVIETSVFSETEVGMIKGLFQKVLDNPNWFLFHNMVRIFEILTMGMGEKECDPGHSFSWWYINGIFCRECPTRFEGLALESVGITNGRDAYEVRDEVSLTKVEAELLQQKENLLELAEQLSPFGESWVQRAVAGRWSPTHVTITRLLLGGEVPISHDKSGSYHFDRGVGYRGTGYFRNLKVELGGEFYQDDEDRPSPSWDFLQKMLGELGIVPQPCKKPCPHQCNH